MESAARSWYQRDALSDGTEARAPSLTAGPAGIGIRSGWRRTSQRHARSGLRVAVGNRDVLSDRELNGFELLVRLLHRMTVRYL